MKTLIKLICALLIFSALELKAADKAEYLVSFDPAKGFKPAQRDLTEIFLQLAGSLEAYGSPEPYLRHIATEDARIEALYRNKFGKPPSRLLPDYMTDDYVNRLVANWNYLSPKVGLEPYAKDFGHSMRNAINGTRGTGTILVDVFNHHQERTFRALTGKSQESANFEALRLDLVKQLELEHPSINEERYEVARRDAISFSLGIQGESLKLFQRIDKGLDAAAAKTVTTIVKSAIMDTGIMAQSELNLGIIQQAISDASTASR